ncbi:hypothetical protein FisN_9Hh352 [Fistulifera solaris]|uniref:Phytol kinase n=1 Tax=Fistulifera solaris TaxID=1519565 RepID=A0A1Z5KCS0_FISSO|nr:hypothetical protein FisN_9Hh352 [Fistulifera solaris]|eukprot:GAX24100.1 hypothetical protein FisN_9Hh352 [Fistulifera solaris]
MTGASHRTSLFHIFLLISSTLAFVQSAKQAAFPTRPLLQKPSFVTSSNLQNAIEHIRSLKQQSPLTVLQDTHNSDAVPSDDTISAHKTSSRSVLGVFALSSFSLVTIAAKLGIFPGTPLSNGDFLPYSDLQIMRDLGASLLCGVLAYALVKSITWAATPTLDRPAYLQPRDARKITHTLSATAYMLFWPLFSSATGARYFAAVVPLINGARLILAANVDDDDENSSLASALSRSGSKAEATGGPLIYVGILAAAILLFWRDQPAGVVALSTMAAGDGLADLVGRRFGKNNKWPTALTGVNNRKSIAGSLALVAASVVTSVGILLWLQATGSLLTTLPPFGELVAKLLVITVGAAFVELVPIADDNYTVPMTAAALSLLFF